MLAGHSGAEQIEIGRVEGTETGDTPSVSGSSPAQGVQRDDTFAFQRGGGQRIEVAMIRRDPYLIVAPQVADALSPRAPPPLAPTLARGDEARDAEVARSVDHGSTRSTEALS